VGMVGVSLRQMKRGEMRADSAKVAVEKHYPKDARWVGIGSGSTIVYVVEAITKSNATSRTVPSGRASYSTAINPALTISCLDW
jgi:ribose 5-phosphate isomerase A